MARSPAPPRFGPATLDAVVPELAPRLPVLMLPVRIETRFAAAGRELRVRIFPDTIHIDAHAPALAPDEVAAGQWYWEQRWSAGRAEREVGRGAFRTLAGRFTARRAAWIVRALEPRNLAARKPGDRPAFPAHPGTGGAWSRAATATLLPDRWIVAGYVEDGSGGLRLAFVKPTAAVSGPLHTSPDPGSDQDVAGAGAAIDPGLRWLGDFARAEAQGMALRVGEADVAAGVRLAQGLARVVAFGIDTRRVGEAGVDALEALLRAHAYSDGLSCVAPGTPTNNMDEPADAAPGADALAAALDPMAEPAAAPALERLAGALGIDPGRAQLDRAAEAEDGTTAADMANLLWNATLGQTLDQLLDPLLDEAELAAARRHFAAWVRPAGPLPLLRIGRQPYGILPVVAARRFRGATPGETRLHDLLATARPFWERATAGAPRLGKPGRSLDDNLAEVLEQGALARTSHFRRAFGAKLQPFHHAHPGLPRLSGVDAAAQLTALGVTGSTPLGAMRTEADSRRLGAPWVQPHLGETDAPLEPNYLRAMRSEATAPGGRAALEVRSRAGSLLEALAAQALVYEIDKAIAAIAHRHLVGRGLAARLPARLALRIEELAEPAAAGSRGGKAPLRVASAGALAEVRLPDRTGGKTLHAYLLDQLADPRAPDFVLTADLRGCLDDLARLEQRPAAELDRALRGLLDACSHRLDAWLTSLATRRLDLLRRLPPSRGIALGGFGWVENLAPDAGPESDGVIHAPSLQHAHTAAILRSAHLAHRDAAAQAFAIDLASARARGAAELLEGVAAGRSLGALLGQAFERDLRARDARLGRFIVPLRALYPSGGAAVDGMALAEARTRGDWLAGLKPAPAVAERQALEAEAASLADRLDAVADLLLAEGVHQIVGGNTERAAAALSAIDRQAAPPELDVIRTPAAGVSFSQRVAVLLGDGQPPAAWPPIPGDLCTIAEPRVNAWLGDLIGDPRGIGFAAVVRSGEGGARVLEPVALADLGLAPLAVVLAAGRRREPGEGALRRRIAAAFASRITPAERAAGAQLELSAAPPAGVAVGLAALEALLARAYRLVTRARALGAHDLTPPGRRLDAPPDVAELARRADAVSAAVRAASDRLERVLAEPAPAPDALAGAIEAAALAGADAADDPAALARTLREALARESALASALPDPDLPAALAAHHAARIKALLGEDFPVLAPFALPPESRSEIFASLADAPALLGAARLPLHGWLEQMRRVRPELAGLADCLTAAELLAGRPAQLGAFQLPHRPGSRWIGLPFGAALPEHVEASFVVHAPGLDPAQPPADFAGLLVDEWTEVVPARERVTGIAVHHDAPGARAPQAALLAVHPEPDGRGWTLAMLLDTVNEALDLARIRAVRPQDIAGLEAVLPLLYLPDNPTRDVPSVDLAALGRRATKA